MGLLERKQVVIGFEIGMRVCTTGGVASSMVRSVLPYFKDDLMVDKV
jgi:hypothetical protein